MRLVILALLLLIPSAALAGPLIPLAVLWATESYIAYAAATLIITARGRAKARRQQRDAAIAGLRDRTVTSIASEAPHVLVYGRARVGSAVVAMFTGGDVDQYKYLVCVHAAHECDAIEEIYIFGKPLGTLDSNGDVTGGDYFKTRTEQLPRTVAPALTFVVPQTPIGGHYESGGSVYVYTLDGDNNAGLADYTYDVNTRTIAINDAIGLGASSYYYTYTYATGTSMVRVRKHLGAPSDAADSMLLSEVPSKWSSSAVLRGFCYTVVRLNLNQAEFQGGPPSIEVLMRGKKLYDFRTGTTAWSQNNTLATHDYLTSEICGVDAGDLPMAEFIAAANVCDEAQSFGARYTLNGSVTADEDKKVVLERMVMSMGGEIVDTTWNIYAGKYVSPVMALYVDKPDGHGDVIGKIGISSGAPENEIWNGVRGQYISAETLYVSTDFKPYQNSAYVTADGGELWTDIDFPFTDTAQRVHNLCRIITEDQRNGYTVTAEFSLKAWSVKVGQRITLTSTIFGWSAKIFRVINRRFMPLSGVVELTLKEDAASIWDLADAVTVDDTPNTNLPNPFAIDKLASLTCTSGTDNLLIAQDGTIISRIRAAWPQATTQAVVTNGRIEIEWQRLGSNVWQRTEAKGADIEAFLSPVKDGDFYVVRARTVNVYLNVKSDWTYAEMHQVVGKTEPPSAPRAVAVTPEMVIFTGVTDLDLAGYRVRYNAGANTNLSVGTFLHDRDTLVTGSPWTMPIRLYGINTVMVTSVDTSGNESVAAFDTQDFGVPDVANIADLVDYAALGFSGFIANGTVVGTDLQAEIDPSADIYGTGSGADIYYRDGAADIYGGDQFLALTYIATYASPYNGGTILLDKTVIGSRAAIDYRVDGAALGDIYSGADIYGGTVGIYGDEQQWRAWTGALNPTVADLGLQFRIITDAGSTQGVIDAVAARTEMPSLEQTFGRVLINAAGTTFAPSAGIPPRDWIAIEDVQITPIADGSGAIAGRIKETPDPITGPIGELINGAAVPVTGYAFVRVRGY